MTKATRVHSTPRRTASKTKPKPARSTIQKLCTQFLAAGEVHSKACEKLSTAEGAAERAMPKPPQSIKPTKAAHADLPFYKYHHHAIPSIFIQSELTSLKNNRSLYEKAGDVVTIRHSAKGFPLDDEQKARLARLKRMLADAKRYERARAKVERRFKIAKLERTMNAAAQSQAGFH